MVNIDSILLIKYLEPIFCRLTICSTRFRYKPHQAECVRCEVNLEWRGLFSYTVSMFVIELTCQVLVAFISNCSVGWRACMNKGTPSGQKEDCIGVQSGCGREEEDVESG